ncbi:diguanylate cyclase (GGDEF)-like protein [Sphingobium fontiphilum]|uniref:diguanylate cyclase n=1 Tax=Sphingobium fontiphilum TaxID=944425 RepID=A0A7W6GMT5_9SPHN|nr:GGDEF domain-containing protein [Sphingobium fontiphilum]MBB3981571.1 diguanylate cyclase (GGDEF)-like protein [Sphingobium fontiphilum]
MNPAFIILALLFFTSVVMMIAMGVAWVHFGRKRHVLTWTASYAVSAIQWVLNAAGLALHSGILMALAAMTIIFSSVLVLVGVRQRAGRTAGLAWLGPVSALAGLVASYAALSENRPLLGIFGPGYVGVLIAISALELTRVDRRLTPPERMFVAILSLLALFQIGLVVNSARDLFMAGDAGLQAYRAMLGLGLPSIYVASCVAGVMVVAGDLAEQLREQLDRDPLTNVLNRRGLESAARRAIANAHRHKRPLTMVICDIDDFKSLNDGHGHIAGDAALRGFAQLLHDGVRRGDVVGRLGGDEFGILLVDTPVEAAIEVMERIRRSVAEADLRITLPRALRASFGLSELLPEDSHMDDLVHRADKALYEAKNAGRDRVIPWRGAA